MQTSDSVVDCSSPSEDDDAPPSSVPLVVGDVLDRDQDDVGIESSCRMMAYDELHEILSWMPAKSAIRYSSSLCKWLCNIHSEPRFIQKQCIRSYGQDRGFFLQHVLGKYRDVPDKIEFHVPPWAAGSAFGIPPESLSSLPKHGRILSSSNGLLLLGSKVGSRSLGGSYEFRVCNPATREWASLPTPKGFKCIVNKNLSPLIECYPWGHDPLDGVEFPIDYTIALPVQEDQDELPWWLVQGRWEKNHKQQLLIYSNGRWEDELCDVSIEGRVIRYDIPVALFSEATKGLVVHYVCYSDNPQDGSDEPYIAVFDIREKKKLREIKLPAKAWIRGMEYRLWIYKWNETSICLVRWAMDCGWISMWVLDNYGCKGEQWRKLMHKVEWDLWDDCENESVMGVGVATGKGLLIATYVCDMESSRVYVYVVEGEDQGKLEMLGEHHLGLGEVAFMPYANTLRPVRIHNASTFTY